MTAGPQVLLIAADRDRKFAGSVERVASVEFEVHWVEWPGLAVGAYPTAWCRIVAAARLGGGGTRGSTWPREPDRMLPCVWVTPRPAGALAPRLDSRSEIVVWAEEIDRSLRDSVRRVRIGGINAMARMALVVARGISVPARQAALAALRVRRPPRTISELAGMTGWSRAHLSHGWLAPDTAQWGQLQYFLDWILLMEALGMKTRALAWVDVAARLHVHERTLARSAQRFFGIGLGAASADLHRLLGDDAVRGALRSLLGDAAL